MKLRGLQAAVLLGLLAGRAPGQEEAAGRGAFTVGDGGRLNFQARDLEVSEALAQLRQLLHKNIVVSPQVTQRFTGDLYGVTLEEALDAICRSTGLVYKVEDAYIYVGPAEVETRLFRLSYVRAEDLLPLVQTLLTPRGNAVATRRASSGIAPNESDAGGDAYAAPDALLVTDLPGSLARVAKAVRAMDVRPVQVRIEATILSADLDNDRAVGVDLNVLTGIDFRDVSAVSPGGGDLKPGDIPPALLDREISSAGTALLDAFPQGGLTVGLIKNSVALFIRALQERTNVRVLANPSVMVLNKQRGQVVVGRRDGYLTTTVTETASTQSVEFLETGTRLLFRPFVGHDGYIRLEIHPEDSDGGITANGLPFKETAEVTTNILARDGETVVIGGLFRERTVRTRKRVPGVDKVPLLGPALRSSQEEVRREELIILLTPHVVHPDEESGGPGSGDVLERPITEGGERLARAYVSAALALLAEGNAAGAERLLRAARAIRPELAAVNELRRSIARAQVRPVEDPRVANRVLVRALNGAEER